jgi:fumarylpyruvate hydrolase
MAFHPPNLFPLAQRTLPILNRAERFPVHRVYCVGRNYAAHAREFGNDDREPPFFFMKPADALQPCHLGSLDEHPYPPMTENYHHEVELVALLDKGGRDIAVAHALEHVFGYAVGLDMTRRDLQRQMGDAKKPWEIGKGADHSGPIGPIHPATMCGHMTKGFIRCAVNGAMRQDSDVSQMTWSVAEQIAYLSRYFELKAGDVIFSGTPEGVGPIVRGDTMECAIEGLGSIRLKVV